MGVHNRVVIDDTTASSRIDSLIQFLNNTDGITAEAKTEEISSDNYDGVLYAFDGADILCFFGYKTGGLLHTACWVKNGENTIYGPVTNGNDFVDPTDLAINTYISDECKIVSINDASTSRGGLETILIGINNAQLIGYGGNTTIAELVDISSLTFKDVADTAGIQYTYANMFPYAANAGTLDFLAQSYFVNGGVRKFTSTFMMECSTVSLGSTVSLTNPLGNHLAIGAHCLVPLDQGGNE